MKKHLIIVLLPCILVAFLTACAPKINSSAKPNDADNLTTHAVYESFNLYFPNVNESKLVKETHELRISNNVSNEKLILDTLKMGATNDELISPISESAVVHSIKTVSGLCTVDLSNNFLNTQTGNTAEANLMLHAIVQSLCELETIQEVKINIDGNTTAKINDSIDLSQPLIPDPVRI